MGTVLSYFCNTYNILNQFMSKAIMIQIYSSPNFAVETLMGFLMCVVNVLLYYEIEAIEKRFNFVYNTKQLLQKQMNKTEHCPSTTTFMHPNLGVKVVFQNDIVKLKTHWEVRNKINQILNMSPDEYIRRDLVKLNYELESANEGHEDEVFKRFIQPGEPLFLCNDEKLLKKVLNYIRKLEVKEEEKNDKSEEI